MAQQVIADGQGTVNVTDIKQPRQHLADDGVRDTGIGSKDAVDVAVPFLHQFGFLRLPCLQRLDALQLPLVLRELRQRQFVFAALEGFLPLGSTLRGDAGFFALLV